jgi:hypothetical protein
VLLIDQVTPLDPPFTVAVKFAVPPPVKLADVGLMVTETGASEIVALPAVLPEGSELSVAVSFIDCGEVIGLGVRYVQLLPPQLAMLPCAPLLKLHVTAVWLVPSTVAVKVMDCPGLGVTLEGETSTVTVIGVSVIWTRADWVASAVEVAVIVTVVLAEISEGATN